MKKSTKISFMLVALVTVLTLTAFICSVRAIDNASFQASISTNNKGVSEDALNTFTINNTGTAQLTDVNVTIPNGGYTNLRNLFITSQPEAQSWTITRLDNYILLNASSKGLNTGQNIAFTFDAKNPSVAGNYKWVVVGNVITSTDGIKTPTNPIDVNSSVEITAITAALMIFGIAAGIALLNTGLNRLLISYFVGWEQYRVMQKEMNEYRQETMAAARANDKKQMEKLKRKQSQVNAMQAKMMKPQMVQFGISFLYIFVWFFVLTPTFGNTSLVYLPGFGAVSVIYWYPIASFFLGLLGSRLLGIMPIEN